MNLKFADRVLSEKHRENGLYLAEDEHYLYLMLRRITGDSFPVAVFGVHASLEAVVEAADQYLCELMSGITFERR